MQQLVRARNLVLIFLTWVDKFFVAGEDFCFRDFWILAEGGISLLQVRTFVFVTLDFGREAVVEVFQIPKVVTSVVR